MRVLLCACLCTLAPRAVSQSPGCGSAQHPGTPGATTEYRRSYAGQALTHYLSLPAAYSPSVPVPLLFFFHGWGAGASSCGSLCEQDAPAAGFAVISVQGLGAIGGSPMPSWNGSLSASSPGWRGATCQPNATSYCYDGCRCADNCDWTTCLDSVGEVVDLLDALEASLCLDRRRVWASGCSNGGIFLYQLARDARIAPRLAGLLSQVGLPLIGALGAPAANPRMSYMANLGSLDTTVPPLCNTNESDRSLDTASQTGGWYYQTARSTSDSIGAVKGCRGPRVATAEWGIGAFPELACSKLLGCPQGDVVECLEPHGHACGLPSQNAPMLAFAAAHPLADEDGN